MNYDLFSWTHENHYIKGYNDNWETLRKTKDDVWRNNFGVISRTPKSWREECINSAKLIRERTDMPIWVLLSGGIDSEVVVRSFYEAKIPINIAIIRFAYQYNAHDILFAIDLCDSLNLKYHFFDIDVIKFLEENFWDSYFKYQMISPLPSIVMNTIEKIDGLPIVGMGDGYIERTTCTNDFFDVEFEYESTYDKFFNVNERHGISSFFQYTPEQILSFLYSKQVDNFIKHSKQIKLSYFTPWKWLVYNEHFPELKPRVKNHGFEILYGLVLDYRREITEKMNFDDHIYTPHEEYIAKLKGDL